MDRVPGSIVDACVCTRTHAHSPHVHAVSQIFFSPTVPSLSQVPQVVSFSLPWTALDSREEALHAAHPGTSVLGGYEISQGGARGFSRVAAAFSSYDGDLSLPLGLALGSPIFPSGCEGKLGVALESLQGRRDLT